MGSPPCLGRLRCGGRGKGSLPEDRCSGGDVAACIGASGAVAGAGAGAGRGRDPHVTMVSFNTNQHGVITDVGYLT